MLTHFLIEEEKLAGKARQSRSGGSAATRPRVWPARVMLGAWAAALFALAVAGTTWVPAALAAGTAAIVAASVLLGAFAGARLEAALEVPGHARKGAPAQCALVLRSASVLPVWRAQAPVRIANPVTGEEVLAWLPAAIGPHGTARIPLQVESPFCGELSLAADAVWVLDVLGIVRRRRPVHARARLALPPAAAPLAARQTGAFAHDIESFTYAQDRPGDDPGETFAVRAYEPGDSVRRIHWKLTGKLGEVMLRESGFPIYSSLLLLMETGWDEPGPAPALADAQMEAAASAMASLLEAGVAFELAYLDRSAGRVVIRRIADEAGMWDAVGLLMAAPREAAPEGSIGAFLEQAGETVWGRCIYMTAGTVGADASALSAMGGACTVLRCVEDGDTADGLAAGVVPSAVSSSSSEVRFAPSTWKNDLAEAVL